MPGGVGGDRLGFLAAPIPIALQKWRAPQVLKTFYPLLYCETGAICA